MIEKRKVRVKREIPKPAIRQEAATTGS